MSKKIIIACVDANYGLGKDNQLLYQIPADMKHFKNTTTGHTVIMGYNTFVSINKKPLENRRNIVISEQPIEHIDNIEVVSTLQDAFEISETNDKVYVIGGAYTYDQAMKYVDELDITLVNSAKESDVYFPTITEEWECVSQEFHTKEEDSSGHYNYSFNIYERK